METTRSALDRTFPRARCAPAARSTLHIDHPFDFTLTRCPSIPFRVSTSLTHAGCKLQLQPLDFTLTSSLPAPCALVPPYSEFKAMTAAALSARSPACARSAPLVCSVRLRALSVVSGADELLVARSPSEYTPPMYPPRCRIPPPLAAAARASRVSLSLSLSLSLSPSLPALLASLPLCRTALTSRLNSRRRQASGRRSS